LKWVIEYISPSNESKLIGIQFLIIKRLR